MIVFVLAKTFKTCSNEVGFREAFLMKTVNQALCLFTILTLAATTFVGNGQVFLTNGLVAYYPFNGNANDVSGNGNDGIVSGAVLTTDRFGVPSDAYKFASLGQGITTSQANGFPISTNDFTVSLWVNVTSDSGTHQTFVSNQASEQFNIHIGPIQDSQTQIGFQSGGTGAGFTPFIPWTLGQWYNVQVVRSQNTIVIYRDGVQLSQQTTTLGNDAPLGQRNLTFGYNPTYSPVIQQVYGLLDDIRIYSRALSTTELQQLYQYESGPRITLIKAVKPSFYNLSLGTNYQLQVSGDLNTWTNQGSPFTATNTTMIYPQYWDVADWSQLFFRLQRSP
jgi:hypothetical protein